MTEASQNLHRAFDKRLRTGAGQPGSKVDAPGYHYAELRLEYGKPDSHFPA